MNFIYLQPQIIIVCLIPISIFYKGQEERAKIQEVEISLKFGLKKKKNKKQEKGEVWKGDAGMVTLDEQEFL